MAGQLLYRQPWQMHWLPSRQAHTDRHYFRPEFINRSVGHIFFDLYWGDENMLESILKFDELLFISCHLFLFFEFRSGVQRTRQRLVSGTKETAESSSPVRELSPNPGNKQEEEDTGSLPQCVTTVHKKEISWICKYSSARIIFWIGGKRRRRRRRRRIDRDVIGTVRDSPPERHVVCTDQSGLTYRPRILWLLFGSLLLPLIQWRIEPSLLDSIDPSGLPSVPSIRTELSARSSLIRIAVVPEERNR